MVVVLICAVIASVATGTVSTVRTVVGTSELRLNWSQLSFPAPTVSVFSLNILRFRPQCIIFSSAELECFMQQAQLPFLRLSRYKDWNVHTLGLTDTPKIKIDPENILNHPQMLGEINIERSVSRLWTEQIADMKKLFRMIEEANHSVLAHLELQERISGEIQVINQTINSARDYGAVKRVRLLEQERAEFMKLLELIINKNFNELKNLLKEKLDIMEKEAENVEFVLTVVSPEELAHAMAMATEQQQMAVQQQMEKIGNFQRVIAEEGAPTLRRRQQDERREEIRLLLMLLFLFFLLCYCSEGTMWYVDIELTFGSLLVLTEIVLLLGGDIEKNPGPLTGTVSLL